MSNKPEKKEANKIEWIGMDGFLCLLFVVLSAFIGFCLINNVEVVIGYVVPIGVAVVTLLVFLKYITEVFTFSKKGKKGKK